MVKKILVSQPKPSSDKSPYYDIENRYGVEIVFRPFINVVSVSPREFRAQHIDLSEFTAIVFNSKHAIDHFFNLAKELRVTIPEDMKYFCITEKVSLYIQKYVQYRKRKVFYGDTGKMDSVLPAMLRHKNEKFFIPLSDVHSDEIANLMKSNKLNYTEGIMYRTVSNDFAEDEAFDFDMLIFFSPSGIQSLLKNFPDFKEKYSNTVVGTFGANTTRAAIEAGLDVALDAPSPKYPSISAALSDYLKNHNA